MDFFSRYAAAVRKTFVPHMKRFWRQWVVVGLVICVVVGYRVTLSPPTDFPAGSLLSVARGASVADIAQEFASARLIAHPSVLQFILRISNESEHVQAGTYLFSAPEGALSIAYRLVTGAYGLPSMRITVPEGETVRDIAARVNDAFPDISEADFIAAAGQYEGYLFPDTYFFSPSSDSPSIVQAMRTNFDTKIAPFTDDIHTSGHTFSDIITMASLIEREARTDVDKHIVAGILFKRLSLGMPLQVDAVFGYIFGRDTYSPSLADLKVDSPYNTYTHIGLPPGPIDSPGLESIEAVLHPTKTEYLFYLTGKDGLMHYAATFVGHQANQRKYLK